MSGHVTPSQLLDSLSSNARGEIYQVRSSQLPVSFRGGVLESIRAIETTGRALRVIQDGRLGFSTSTDLSDSTILVRNALESAQFGDPVTFGFPARRDLPAVQVFDPAVEELDARQMIAVGEEIVDQLRSYDAAMQIDVQIDRRIEEIELLNSSGLHLADRRTTYGIGVSVTRARGDDIVLTGRRVSSHRKQEVDGPALVKPIVERLRQAETIAQVTTKPMPVVFSSEGTLPLFLPLIMGLDGRQVYLGTSPLGSKLGQRAFDPRFTLIDDGLVEGSARSAAFDDEGTPTSAKPLVDHGTLRQFLYDIKTAAQVGAEPTGNGFRTAAYFASSYQVPPAVVPTTWVVPAGSQSLDEILAGFDEALLVEAVIGLGQGNILSGEFSNNVGMGFLVCRGEVAGRVKNTMIAGNVYDLLKDHLVALSDRSEWVEGILRVPDVAIEGVGVIGR